MKIYLELYFIKKYLKGNRWIIAAIFGMLVVSLISAPIPYIIGYILDIIIVNIKSTKLLTVFVLGLVAMYVIKMIGTYFYQLCFVKTQQSVLNKIKLEVINNIMSAPLSFFDKNDRGYIGGRYSEVQQLAALFSPQVVGNFWGFFEIIIYIIIMLCVNWKITLGIVIMIPLYFVMSTLISKQVIKNSSAVNEVYSQFNGEIFETLSGIEDIKLLNAKELRSKKIEIKINEFSNASIKQSKIIISYIQSVILANDLISAVVLWVCGIMIIRKTLSIGTYMSFTLYIAKILSNIQNLGALEMTVKPICVIIQRIKDFLYMDSEDGKINVQFNESIKKVEFKNVFFKYPKEKQYILNDFSYNFSCGDKILLKGNNGSGKTTLTKLFTGLYLPDKGEILINGKSISKMSKKDLRNKIGIVTQDVFLFKGTVVENILLGSSDNKSKKDVIDTVEKLELQKYINQFPRGLDTDIQQNGDGISGGQKQIVAFLRAVVGHKDILILDEATSNLDKDTNKLLLNIIKHYRMAKIVIVITHQNDIMDFANKILDLDSV